MPAAHFSHLIEHVVRETAEAKDVVIVAHGASHVLGGRPEVLRVFVTGSPERRAVRLASESGAGEKDAAKSINDADKERAGYLDRFYKVKQELPVHYDLTLNTDNMTADAANALSAQGIAFAAPQIDVTKLAAHKDAVVKKLTDGLATMARARKVSVIQGTGRFRDAHHLEMTANGGAVQIVRFESAIIAAGSS